MNYLQFRDVGEAIDYYVTRLRAAGARGVDGYEKTVHNNSGNESQVLIFFPKPSPR
jgi:hypothetical protein